MSFASSSTTRKAASRYTSFDTQSSSTELKKSNPTKPNTHSSIAKVKNEQNFATMVKRFVEKRTTSKPNSAKGGTRPALPLIVPVDFIAEDLKKAAKKGSTLGALPKKLFGKASSSEKKVKALAEVKSNTRTLAMVLRSERELLGLSKEQESEIAELKALLQERTFEVEKLKDLCLKQREEIKALKSAILFPDEMNFQLQELLEKQGSELKEAKQVIPTLQRQISSLTGQLHCLSEDLAEVKAVKYTGRISTNDSFSLPRTLVYNEEEASNSLDFSSDEAAMPDSPDTMLLKDVNPCLTPYYSKMKPKDYETSAYDYSEDGEDYEVNPGARKLSMSSDHFSTSRPQTNTTHVAFCRSDESKYGFRKRMERHVL